MGLLFSKVWTRMIGSKEMRILMLGLDAAGKTTILYRLKLSEVVTTIPTVGLLGSSVLLRNPGSFKELPGTMTLLTLFRIPFRATKVQC